MDPVTHATSGILVSQAVRGRFASARFLLPFCLLLALLPDVDNFLNSDPVTYLVWHRGITHSFLGGAALAALMSVLFKPLSGGASFRKIFTLSYGLILLHIFLDLITSFGTQVFLPFSDYRASLDAVFIIDPIMTVSMLLFCVLAARAGKAGTIIATVGVVWVLAYPCLNMYLRETLTQRQEQILTAADIPHEAVHVTPDALTPYYWKVVIDNGETWTLTTMNAMRPDQAYPMEIFDKADRSRLRALGEKNELFAVWEWFSVYPYRMIDRNDGGKTVEFGDLRFVSTGPVLDRIFPRDHTPFVLTATFGPDGALTEYSFSHGSEQTLYKAN